MSDKQAERVERVSSEEARLRLGELATAAAAGATVVVTASGSPAAAITAVDPASVPHNARSGGVATLRRGWGETLALARTGRPTVVLMHGRPLAVIGPVIPTMEQLLERLRAADRLRALGEQAAAIAEQLAEGAAGDPVDTSNGITTLIGADGAVTVNGRALAVGTHPTTTGGTITVTRDGVLLTGARPGAVTWITPTTALTT